jgi:hypothetical protein
VLVSGIGTRFKALGYFPALIVVLLGHRPVHSTSTFLIFYLFSRSGDRPRGFIWIRSYKHKYPSFFLVMLSRRLHLPASILISRPTSTWLYYHKRNHSLAYVASISASTLPPSPLSTFPFYTPHPHILSSADPDPHPDVELEKCLGTNRNLDHDPSSLQRHNRSLNHGSSSPHDTSEKILKRFSSEPDPPSPPPPLKDKGKKKADITDREWEIRTGELTILHMYQKRV